MSFHYDHFLILSDIYVLFSFLKHFFSKIHIFLESLSFPEFNAFSCNHVTFWSTFHPKIQLVFLSFAWYIFFILPIIEFVSTSSFAWLIDLFFLESTGFAITLFWHYIWLHCTTFILTNGRGGKMKKGKKYRYPFTCSKIFISRIHGIHKSNFL